MEVRKLFIVFFGFCFCIGGYIAIYHAVRRGPSTSTSFYSIYYVDPPISQTIKSNPNVTVYVVMPTYLRLMQRSLITIQCQMLAEIPNLHLIVVEDGEEPTITLRNTLARYHLNFTHIACSSKVFCRLNKQKEKKCNAKGSAPRNCGLEWLKLNNINDGVIYFADDDNFYDKELFEELRKTKKVGLFPVAGFRGTWISSPLIKDGKIIDFVDSWKAKRRWPVDMAGFSVSVKFWRERGSPIFTSTKGYLETKFIEAMNTKRNDIDVLADGASKVYVWHNSIRKIGCLGKKSGLFQLSEKYDNFKQLKHNLVMCT